MDGVGWEEAGNTAFTPSTPSYLPGAPEKGYGLTGGETVMLICVAGVEPLRRNLTHGVFNDDHRRRVVDLLKGFRNDDRIPPVRVNKLPDVSADSYQLSAGAHRFYCSVAAGYPVRMAANRRGSDRVKPYPKDKRAAIERTIH